MSDRGWANFGKRTKEPLSVRPPLLVSYRQISLAQSVCQALLCNFTSSHVIQKHFLLKNMVCMTTLNGCSGWNGLSRRKRFWPRPVNRRVVGRWDFPGWCKRRCFERSQWSEGNGKTLLDNDLVTLRLQAASIFNVVIQDLCKACLL